ncbi:MAG: SH3 domain-containing protein [Leptolyngbya foveolarum]|uniref:SH3 domain-containing protein n=1 Tax=Leptolyngbya foveolarum TaxID=47253 RepID=A0A2W4TZH4_9CYAN|nr:MAG: SH3 domain-containing protein [Leptolyngbya foveolarum]
MVMKNFLLGLSKFVLGIILAMLIMSIAGLAMARFFMTRMVELPERPTYDSELPEADRPNPTASDSEASLTTPKVVVSEAAKPEEKPKNEEEALQSGEYKATVNQSVGLILRDGPGPDYGQIGGIEYQQSMVVVAEDNGWLKVKLSNGQTGWIKDGNISRE